MLIENELIEYFGGNKIFRTSENGLNLLKIHNEMTDLLHIFAEKE